MKKNIILMLLCYGLTAAAMNSPVLVVSHDSSDDLGVQCATILEENQLIEAISSKDRERVERLIEKGVNVNATDKDGYPPIVYLSIWGMTPQMRPHVIPVLQKLLKAGAHPDATGDCGDTALMWFAHDGHAEAIQLLLSHGATVDLVNSERQSALHYAARNGKTDAIRALLDGGASIDKKGGKMENSALLEAIAGHGLMGRDNVPAVTLLLERGAATDLRNKEDKMSRQVMNDIIINDCPLAAGDPMRVAINSYFFKNKKNK